jgi:hypothetical protein
LLKSTVFLEVIAAGDLARSCAMSVNWQDEQSFDLFLDIFCSLDPFSNLLFIGQMSLTGECFVQPGSEIRITQRIGLPHLQELCCRELVNSINETLRRVNLGAPL